LPYFLQAPMFPGAARLKRPNAQVNRQKCEAFLSVLNLQLGCGAKA
jgi:hypothetical protein